MGVVRPLRDAWFGVFAPDESGVGASKYSFGDSRILENESACLCRGAGWLLALDLKKFQDEVLFADVPEDVPGREAGLVGYDEPLSESLSPPILGDWLTLSLVLL